ncbi:MAG: hypothetical protein FWG93_00900 [Oscillospiraceae bacterium]|nr:hypothetical protein [Oscillospiraceae bacterium]
MKTTKRLWVLTLALALILTLIPAVSAAGEYTAEFAAQFNPDVNGDVGEWPDLSGVSIAFDLGAESTLTVEFDAPVAFGGNYAAINTDVPFPGHTGEIVSFTLDGVEVEMGAAYINGEGIGGGLRLALCNKWNSDIEEQPVDVETLGEFSVLEITFIVFSSDEPPPPPPPAPETPAFDPNGEYTAYLGIQGSNWIFRNAWADASFGENGSVWADYDGNHFFSLFETEDGSVHPGTFTDVTLKGNGTYRASLTGADFSGSIANGAADAFNLLFLSTNIPIAGEPLEFSDVRVIIGGSTRHTFRDMDTIVIEGADKGYYEIHCINRWNGELGGEDGLFGYVVPTGGEEIAIEFTVSGFAYDNEDAEPPAPTLAPPPPTEPPAPAEDGGGLRVWLLALILLGAAAGAAAIAVAVVVLVKKSKKKQ